MPPGKRKLKVFISMPFTGKEYSVLMKERKQLHKLVTSYGFDMVEQFVGYQFEEDFKTKSLDPTFIVGKDKNWIMESDIVIADLTSNSIGAYQEIVLAKELFDKKVYAVVPLAQRNHYWLRFYVDQFFDSVEQALKKVKENEKSFLVDRGFDKRQYDYIANEYRLIENTPAQKGVYDPTLQQFLAKHCKGKKVAVLHCASGYRARLAKRAGAAEVAAMDLSHKQIHLAMEEELKNPLGIVYSTHDPYSTEFVKEIPKKNLHYFDAVIGDFLIDHATTKDELLILAKNIKALLKKNGLFFGLSDNPHAKTPSDSKYGVVLNADRQKMREGAKRRISIYQNGKEVMHFYNFVWYTPTITVALRKAGFSDVRIKDTEVPAITTKNSPKGFWDAYMRSPDQISISAGSKVK